MLAQSADHFWTCSWVISDSASLVPHPIAADALLGHPTEGGGVPQEKGSTEESALSDPQGLIVKALEDYNAVQTLSKFPESKAEEVLNDLQRLLQVQHHMPVLSEQEGGLRLHDLMTIHKGEHLPMSKSEREQESVCWPCECGTRRTNFLRVCAVSGTLLGPSFT